MRISLKRTFEPEGYELQDLMNACRPADASRWELVRIGENQGATVCVSQVKGEVPPHYFKRHDRVICVLNGIGVAEINGTRFRVKPGATLIAPRGAVYRYIPTSSASYFAITLFTPRYTGRDIKYLKQPKAAKNAARPAKKAPQANKPKSADKKPAAAAAPRPPASAKETPAPAPAAP